jgi:hypothetical protein
MNAWPLRAGVSRDALIGCSINVRLDEGNATTHPGHRLPAEIINHAVLRRRSKLIFGVWRELGSDEVRWDVTARMATSRLDTDMDEAMALTPAERNYTRRELDLFFSTLPTVADGFPLKTWRTGPQAGQPKLPPAARGLLDRGLVRLDTASPFPRLFFTSPRLAELKAMFANRRFADPVHFAHVRRELGIDG